MSQSLNKSLVVVSWDGISTPLSHILKDTSPNFDLFIIDYSGVNHEEVVQRWTPSFYFSKKSECKGDLINNVYDYLKVSTKPNLNYNYIGFIDDDIFFTISDLNKLFFIATLEKLDVFQASLTHDSYYNHRQFIHKAGTQVQATWWVEIMAPFYSYEVFLAAGPYFNKSISGTGTDVYLIPTIQQIIGKTITAVVHSVQMKHCRPIRTDNRIFSNQKNNLEEIAEMQILCKELIVNHIQNSGKKPSTDFFKEVLNKKYIYGIPLAYKIRRIGPMLKNIYKLLVDASYR
jgi:hypothetical protein